MALQALRDHLFEQDGPADQAVAAFPGAGLHRQVQVPGLVDEAGDFAGCLCDVQQQRASLLTGLLTAGPIPAGPNRTEPDDGSGESAGQQLWLG
jgi:hypothetical protein